MKKIVILLAVILCTTSVIAQDAPKVEVFGGYAYTNVDTKGLAGRQSLNGWDADVAFHATKNISIVGDISGAYKTETVDLGLVVPVGTAQMGTPDPKATVTTVDAKLRVYNYLFGPRFSVNTGKITPFAEALFGIAHITVAADVAGVTGSISSNGFGMALGGGLDYNASKNVSIRLAKFDYMLNRVSNSDLGFTASENLNNYRIATGIVFKF